MRDIKTGCDKTIITNNWVIKNHREPQHLNKHQRNMNWNIQSTVTVCDETKDSFHWFNTWNGLNGHGIPEASSLSDLMANTAKPLKSWKKNSTTDRHVATYYDLCTGSVSAQWQLNKTENIKDKLEKNKSAQGAETSTYPLSLHLQAERAKGA